MHQSEWLHLICCKFWFEKRSWRVIFTQMPQVCLQMSTTKCWGKFRKYRSSFSIFAVAKHTYPQRFHTIKCAMFWRLCIYRFLGVDPRVWITMARTAWLRFRRNFKFTTCFFDKLKTAHTISSVYTSFSLFCGRGSFQSGHVSFSKTQRTSHQNQRIDLSCYTDVVQWPGTFGSTWKRTSGPQQSRRTQAFSCASSIALMWKNIQKLK